MKEPRLKYILAILRTSPGEAGHGGGTDGVSAVVPFDDRNGFVAILEPGVDSSGQPGAHIHVSALDQSALLQVYDPLEIEVI